jgi:hypothetical protein
MVGAGLFLAVDENLSAGRRQETVDDAKQSRV